MTNTTVFSIFALSQVVKGQMNFWRAMPFLRNAVLLPSFFNNNEGLLGQQGIPSSLM